MKISVLFSFIILLGISAFGQDATGPNSGDAYHGIRLVASSPPLHFKQFQQDFGHEYIRSSAVPVSVGAGWAFRGKNRLGAKVDFLYVPLNFDLDYDFVSNPDPLVPAFSEYRNDYLSLRLLADFALLRKEKIELYVEGGVNVLFLLNYAESTVFTNNEIGLDRFRDSFSKVVGGFELGLGGRYFVGNRCFFDLEAQARYFTASIETMEFTDMKNLSLGLQLGFGYKLNGK